MKTLLSKKHLQLITTVYESEQTGRALYQVRHRELGLKYALKKMSLKTNSKQVVLKEVAALNRLPFGFVPHCHDVFEENNNVYLLIDWIAGSSMAQRFIGPPIDTRDLVMRLHALENAAIKVSEIHKSGLYHRDIKPDNIVFQDDGRRVGSAHLIDFGMALQNRGIEEGTIGYRAPEQDLKRDKNITGATDIFALGQVGWFLLSGEPRQFEYNADYTDWEESESPLYPAFINAKLISVLGTSTAFDDRNRQKNVNQFIAAISSARRQCGMGAKK